MSLIHPRLAADTITIDDDDGGTRGGGGSGTIGLAEVEGRVQTWDGSDSLTLSVEESDFYVANGILTVVGVSTASFYKGTIAQVRIGQELDISGNWDGSVLTAKFVEIDDGDELTANVCDSP